MCVRFCSRKRKQSRQPAPFHIQLGTSGSSDPRSVHLVHMGGLHPAKHSVNSLSHSHNIFITQSTHHKEARDTVSSRPTIPGQVCPLADAVRLSPAQCALSLAIHKIPHPPAIEATPEVPTPPRKSLKISTDCHLIHSHFTHTFFSTLRARSSGFQRKKSRPTDTSYSHKKFTHMSAEPPKDEIGPGTIIDGFEVLEQIGKVGFRHVHKRIRHTCIQL